MTVKKRDLNFELFRILLMLFVIILHFLGHGKILELAKFNTIDYYVYWFFRAAAYPCVNCFVFLSGYYMIKSSMKISKIFRMEFQVIFYSMILWLATVLIKYNTFSLRDLLYSITPVSSNIYWYVTAYILLLIISPLLNYAINNISKRTFGIILAILLFYTSVIPTFIYWSRDYIGKGRDLLWFIALYLIAAYIRKYDIQCKKIYLFIIYVVCCGIMVMSNAVVGNLTLRLTGSVKAVDILYANNSIVIVIASISLFLLFKEIEIEKNKKTEKISYISSVSFGAYLFHENVFFRGWLWAIIRPSRYIYSNYAVIKTLSFMVLSVSVIFLIGVILEIIRIKLFKLIGLEKAEHIIAEKIDNKLK